MGPPPLCAQSGPPHPQGAGSEWTPHPPGAQSGPPQPSCAQSRPPTLVCSAWAQPSCAQSGAPPGALSGPPPGALSGPPTLVCSAWAPPTPPGVHSGPPHPRVLSMRPSTLMCSEWGPHLRVLSVGSPHPPGVQSGPPTLVCSAWAPSPLGGSEWTPATLVYSEWAPTLVCSEWGPPGGSEWPPPPGAQSGPPTFVCSAWAPPTPRGYRVDPRPSCAQRGLPPPAGGSEWTPDPRVLSVGPSTLVYSRVGPPLGSEWTTDLRVLSVGPFTLVCSEWGPPWAQSGPPTLVCSAWAPSPFWTQWAPPGWCLAPGMVGSSPVGSAVQRPPAPGQSACTRPGGGARSDVWSFLCVSVCPGRLHLSASFGSDTRYSSLFSSAPAGPPSLVFSFPARPLVPPLSSPPPRGSASVTCPALALPRPAASPVPPACAAEKGRRLRGLAALPSTPLGGAGRAGACAAPRLR